jgi:LysR family hydrogen peroxide-inducible transcriptional activator
MLGTDDAIQRVLADEFDLALVVMPIVDSRLEVTPLFSEPVLLAVPGDHRLAHLAVVELAEALSAPDLLLSMPGLGLRSMVDASAREAGLEVRSNFELRSQQAILALVASGGGIAFAPRMSLAGRSDVVGLLTEPLLSREIGWIRRRGRHLPAIAAELLEMLAEPL